MKHTILSSVVCSALLLSAAPLAGIQNVQAAVDPVGYTQPIEVKLIDGVQASTQLSFTLSGTYRLKETGALLPPGSYIAAKQGTGLEVKQGSTTLASGDRLTLEPVTYDLSHTLTIGSRSYLGTFKFNLEESIVRPYNTLELEDYLKGVVSHEMSDSWPIEALKAQAVSARTFVKQKGSMSIDNTQKNQVYKGYSPRESNSHTAVDSTRGTTLMYNGKYAETYYSSTNGGTMMSVTNSWGTSLASYPYLTKKSDPYSERAGQHLNWQFQLYRQQINLSGLDLSSPSSWWNTVTERDASIASSLKTAMGLPPGSKIVSVDTLAFKTEPYAANEELNGTVSVTYVHQNDLVDGQLALRTKSVTTRHDRLRAYFGSEGSYQRLRSPNVSSVSFDGSRYTVKGNGWGHGIGMSQWGAWQMAKEGKTFSDILGFYYPGTTLSGGNAPSPTPTPPSIPDPSKETYTVEAGDTLYGISRVFGLTVVQLKTMNGLTNDRIHVGQVLNVGNKKPPVVGTIKTTANDYNQTNVSFSVDQADTVRLSYGNQVLKQWTGAKGTLSYTWNASSIPAGVKTLTVTATNGGGTSKKTASVRLVTVASPSVSALASSQTDKQATLSYVLNQRGNVSISVEQNGKAVRTLTLGEQAAGKKTAVFTGTSYGTYTYRVTLTNPLGSSHAETGSFTLRDTLTPSITSTSASVSGERATISFSTNKEAIVTVRVLKGKTVVKTLAGGNRVKGTHRLTWDGTPGTYTAHVTMTDTSGRTATVSKSFTLVKKQTTTPSIHVVKKGDTLWGISTTYRQSVAKIQSWNKLTSTTLYIGQRLKVGETASPSVPSAPSSPSPSKPVPVITTKTHTVKSGDTLWAISRQYGVSVSRIQSLNKMKTTTLSVGQKLVITSSTSSTTSSSSSTGKTHTVKAGDTLWGISRQYGVSVSRIQSLNNMNSTVLRIGQRVKL